MTKTSRQDIVGAARDLMRDQGYAGTSMKDIADQVGLLKGSLYSHFSGKDALVPEVLALAQTEILDRMPLTGDWLKDYEQALNHLVSLLSANRRCIGLHLAYDLPDNQEVSEHVRSFFASIELRFQQIIQQGLPEERADELATDTITFVEGATLWLTLYDNPSPMNRVRAELLKRASNCTDHDIELPEEARALLDSMLGDWRASSAAERRLAIRVVEAEEALLSSKAALAGFIEAESCFR